VANNVDKDVSELAAAQGLRDAQELIDAKIVSVRRRRAFIRSKLAAVKIVAAEHGGDATVAAWQKAFEARLLDPGAIIAVAAR